MNGIYYKLGLMLCLLGDMAAAGGSDNTSSPYFKGGKLDAFYDRKDNGDFMVNSIVWSPVIKGGYGALLPEIGAQETHYFGAFVRPLLTQAAWGDLVLGAQAVTRDGIAQTEAQGEYRLPSGLGLAGGFVERDASEEDAHFIKISYRNEWRSIKYIMATQWQRYREQDDPGGYLAVYSKQLMATWGNDGEQWRVTAGYVAPDQGVGRLRPALEVFYVDNSIGQVIGSKDLMVSGSLGFRKGFLGHESRLGRAMGPTGVEFGNPLGYLNPNFNRRLTAWEIGEFVNFRFIHKALANGGREETLETVAYPWQALGAKSLFDALFIGLGTTHLNSGKNGVSGLAGFHQRYGNFESSARVQHDFDRDDTTLFVGVIHWL